MNPTPFNPYAPPADPSDTAGVTRPSTGAPQPFGATEVLGVAWQHFQRHPRVLVLATVAWVMARGVVSSVPVVVGQSAELGPNRGVVLQAISLVGVILGQVVAAYLGTGFARLALAILRHREVSLGLVFAGKGVGRNLVLTFALGVTGSAGGAIRLLAAVVDVREIAYIANGLVLVALVPTLLVALALSLTTYFILDHDMPLGEAARASMAATRGRRGEIFLTWLLGALLLFVGILACGFGILVTYPVFMVSFGVIYLRLTGQDPGLEGPPTYGDAGQAIPYGTHHAPPTGSFGPPGGDG